MTGKADWRLIHVGEAKTTVKGFFGQPLAGLTPGLGSAGGDGFERRDWGGGGRFGAARQVGESAFGGLERLGVSSSGGSGRLGLAIAALGGSSAESGRLDVGAAGLSSSGATTAAGGLGKWFGYSGESKTARGLRLGIQSVGGLPGRRGAVCRGGDSEGGGLDHRAERADDVQHVGVYLRSAD